MHLNVDITNIQYKVDRNVLSYSQNGASGTANCGTTIIAFPQTAMAMTVFTPPDATGLSDLFPHVKMKGYWTLLLDDSEGKFATERTLRYHIPLPEIPDNPARNLLYANFLGSSVVVYYQTPSPKTDAQAVSKSLENCSMLIGSTVNESKVQTFFHGSSSSCFDSVLEKWFPS